LYYSSSIRVISRFLSSEVSWIEKIFRRPLREILDEFDRTAHELIGNRCLGDGFVGGALQAAYPAEADTASR
jgi:hypothetical protein